jgi:TetR/AcrR family transcriptional repressor of nem operon
MTGVRSRLVTAGMERFQALGFTACGIQEIVDKAGVPKGSFYNHFKGKECLAAEAVTAYAAGSRIEILAEAGVEPLDRIRRHFEFLATRCAETGFERGCLVSMLTSEASCSTPMLREALTRILAGWGTRLAENIREGQRLGTIRPVLEPEGTARFMINSWLGAVARMKLLAQPEPLDDFFALVFPMLEQRQPACPPGRPADAEEA